MSCFHPLYRVPPEYEKYFPSVYAWKSLEKERVVSRSQRDWFRSRLPDLPEKTFQPISCGQCIGCRMQYSREWADRCVMEAKQYKYNAFITLTYDTPFLTYKTVPDIDHISLETGEIPLIRKPVLVPEQLQLFMKRLRKWFSIESNLKKYGIRARGPIRFFGCGEYGDLHGRPHFHVILFNCDFADRKSWFRKNGFTTYQSGILQQLWPYGMTSVCDVNWETCAYVARYVMKKLKGKAKKYREDAIQLAREAHPELDEIDFQEEFTRMSRKPGIAWQYYQDNADRIYQTDEDFIKTKNAVRKIRPPRYFDRMYDLENPERMKEIKEQRADLAIAAQKDAESRTDLTEEEYMKVRERAAQANLERQKRTLD